MTRIPTGTLTVVSTTIFNLSTSPFFVILLFVNDEPTDILVSVILCRRLEDRQHCPFLMDTLNFYYRDLVLLTDGVRGPSKTGTTDFTSLFFVSDLLQRQKQKKKNGGPPFSGFSRVSTQNPPGFYNFQTYERGDLSFFIIVLVSGPDLVSKSI